MKAPDLKVDVDLADKAFAELRDHYTWLVSESRLRVRRRLWSWLTTLAGDLSVHRVRCQIDLTGPRNRAAVDKDLLKKLHVPQGRECTR
jgi:hypothetical protein